MSKSKGSSNNKAVNQLLTLQMLNCTGADQSFLGKYIKIKTLQDLAASSSSGGGVDATTLLLMNCVGGRGGVCGKPNLY